MRKINFLAAALLLATLLVTGCEKEPENTTNTTIDDLTYETIDNTSWHGVYNTYITSPHGTSYPMVMEWTVDFNGGNRGLVYLHIESPAISSIDEEMPMTNYVYNGDNTGTFDYNTYHMTFTIDAFNRAMEVDSLRFGLELDDTGNKTYFGGRTTLMQTR